VTDSPSPSTPEPPMSPDPTPDNLDLDAAVARHRPNAPQNLHQTCLACLHPWPCPTSLLARERDDLRAERDAARLAEAQERDDRDRWREIAEARAVPEGVVETGGERFVYERARTNQITPATEGLLEYRPCCDTVGVPDDCCEAHGWPTPIPLYVRLPYPPEKEALMPDPAVGPIDDEALARVRSSRGPEREAPAHYAVGFYFTDDFARVALIRKARPAWQRGLLNGIGGRVEPGESSADAMTREYAEETGHVTAAGDWTRFLALDEHRGPRLEAHIDFYWAAGPGPLPVTTLTDEPVSVLEVASLTAGLSAPAMTPNLPWLIPLAVDAATNTRYALDVYATYQLHGPADTDPADAGAAR